MRAAAASRTARGLAVGLVLATLVACSVGKPDAEPVAPVANAPVVALSLEQLPKPLPLPYDAEATPEQVNASLDAAFEKAGKENKRVIVDLGGNWCSWCRMLASVMELPQVKPFMDANFVVVPINVSSENGKTDRNAEALKRLKSPQVDGYPWLVVLEPDETVLNSSYDVTDKDHETPQGMVNWLAGWAKTGAPEPKG